MVILYHHKHSRGTTIGCFGTPGLGSHFVGTDNVEASRTGDAVKTLRDLPNVSVTP